MIQMKYRQGDLLFEKMDKVPKGRRKVRKDNIILRGEATGHAHRLKGGELFELWSWEPGLYIEIKTKGQIVHEEHAPIELEKGFYRVIRQREYSPGEESGTEFVVD